MDHKPFLQIIVTKELPEDENLFLQSLRKNVSVESTRRLLKAAKQAKMDLDAYLCALSTANDIAFKEIKDMGVKEYREMTERKMQQVLELTRRETREEFWRKGIEKGVEKGRQEGHWQGKLDVAERMLARGMSAEDVALMTDIPLDRVAALTAK